MLVQYLVVCLIRCRTLLIDAYTVQTHVSDVIGSYYIIACSDHPMLSWKRRDNDSFAGKLDLSHWI
jgi:hypothetical protein